MPERRIPVMERLARRSVQVDQGYTSLCSCWTGNKVYGYGTIGAPVKNRRAHIVVWEHNHGPVPEGFTIDHLCCDPEWCAGGPTCPHRACHEVTHLALATPRENVLRGNGPAAINARKTRCLNGHPLEGENLITNSRGWRNCRICKRERQRERRREASHARA